MRSPCGGRDGGDAHVDVLAGDLLRMRPSCGRRFSAMFRPAMIFTRDDDRRHELPLARL